jgi:mRNA interferase MazF
MVKQRVQRFEIWLVQLDPTQGSEIKKTRPCVIISPDEMSSLKTVIIAPLTSKGFSFPTRIPITFQGKTIIEVDFCSRSLYIECATYCASCMRSR